MSISAAQAEQPVRSLDKWRILRFGLSFGLLVLVLTQISWTEVVDVFARANLIFVPIIFATVIVERLIASYRWYILVKSTDPRVTYAAITRLLFVTTFAGFFLPASVGVEALRVYGLGRSIDNVPLALSSVLVERLQALAALCLLTLLSLIAVPPGLPDQVAIVAWVGFAGLSAVMFALTNGRVRAFGAAVMVGARETAVKNLVVKILIQLDRYRESPWMLAWGFLVALVFQLSRIVQVLFAVWALSVDIHWLYVLAIMPVIIVITLMPISVGAGIGVREASFVGLFGLVGVSPAEALGMSLFVYVISFGAGLPGAWLWARNGLHLK